MDNQFKHADDNKVVQDTSEYHFVLRFKSNILTKHAEIYTRFCGGDNKNKQIICYGQNYVKTTCVNHAFMSITDWVKV